LQAQLQKSFTLPVATLADPDDATASALANGNAAWQDAGHVTVFLHGGASISEFTTADDASAQISDRWVYAYTATAAMDFAFCWDTSGRAVNGPVFDVSGPGNTLFISASKNPSGSITGHLEAGQRCFISVSQEINADATHQGVITGRSGNASGTFTFAAVPEPSGVTLLAVGAVVLIGGAPRRHRRL
jgi:hypothetical protein